MLFILHYLLLSYSLLIMHVVLDSDEELINLYASENVKVTFKVFNIYVRKFAKDSVPSTMEKLRKTSETIA